VLTGNEERWADLASLRLFNKSFDALMDDFDKTMGGIPSDTLASLIELGKEIEAANAPPSRKSRITRFQKWTASVFALEIASEFFVDPAGNITRLWQNGWQYARRHSTAFLLAGLVAIGAFVFRVSVDGEPWWSALIGVFVVTPIALGLLILILAVVAKWLS